MLNHYFIYNGRSSNEFGIRIEKMPALNRPARKFKSISVPGRNGSVYELQDAWDETVQAYAIYAGGPENGAAVPSFTDIMEWLHSRGGVMVDGYGILQDSYDTEHYREAVYLDDTDIESMWHTYGRAVIRFRCRPEHFTLTQPITVSSGDTITNPTNHIAKPIITLTGVESRSLLGLADKTQCIPPNVVYDTNSLYGVMNLADDGDYQSVYYIARFDTEDRYIYIGDATIGTASVVDNATGAIEYDISALGDDEYEGQWGVGLITPVQPGEYTLSWECDYNSTVYVVLCNSNGYLAIDYIQNKDTVATTWTSSQMTFTVPDNDGYAFIIFGRTEVFQARDPKYRNIMLNYGSEAKPFHPYVAAPASRLTLNQVNLDFDGTFDTAQINCERENFKLDGMNSNQSVSITDAYGNLAVDYLQLYPGRNTITFSGEIESVKIDPRYWVL